MSTPTERVEAERNAASADVNYWSDRVKSSTATVDDKHNFAVAQNRLDQANKIYLALLLSPQAAPAGN